MYVKYKPCVLIVSGFGFHAFIFSGIFRRSGYFRFIRGSPGWAPPSCFREPFDMSVSTLAVAPAAARQLGINSRAAVTAGGLLLIGLFAIDQVVGPRQSALYLLGAAMGLVLYHAAFGFTSAWRVFIADRRGEGLRAQMLMLAIAVMLFFPALSAGSIFGQPVHGNVSPVGVSLLFGAFIFGIGMQIGGGCASGTLYTV